MYWGEVSDEKKLRLAEFGGLEPCLGNSGYTTRSVPNHGKCYEPRYVRAHYISALNPLPNGFKIHSVGSSYDDCVQDRGYRSIFAQHSPFETIPLFRPLLRFSAFQAPPLQPPLQTTNTRASFQNFCIPFFQRPRPSLCLFPASSRQTTQGKP
jgi:hypothetical protein